MMLTLPRLYFPAKESAMRHSPVSARRSVSVPDFDHRLNMYALAASAAIHVAVLMEG